MFFISDVLQIEQDFFIIGVHSLSKADNSYY